MVVFAILASLFVVLVIFTNISDLKRLRRELAFNLQRWKTRLQIPRLYIAEYSHDDEMMQKARELQKHAVGKTAKLINRVLGEIDEITLFITAMSERIDSVEQQAKSAWFFNTDPLSIGLASLKWESFLHHPKDSNGHVDASTKGVIITPSKLEDKKGWQKLRASWKELLAAIALQETAVEDHFPMSGLDRLFEMAFGHNIPRRWLAEYPLITCDVTFYDELREVLRTDPIGFSQKLAKLKKAEADVWVELSRITSAIEQCNKVRFTYTPIPDVRLDPEDDPAVILGAAALGIDIVFELLREADKAKSVIDAIRDVEMLYSRARMQQAAVEEAVTVLDQCFNKATTAKTETRQVYAETRTAVQNTAKTHITTLAEQLIEDAERFVRAGSIMLSTSEQERRDKRVVNARQSALDAELQFQTAISKCRHINEYIKELNQRKTQYEEELALMDEFHEIAVRDIVKYGGDASGLCKFVPPTCDGPTNYKTLLIVLDDQRYRWGDEVLKAFKKWLEAKHAPVPDSPASTV